MIIGGCPYDDCGAPIATACADKCPAWSKEKCETCGKEYWLLHSRVSPEAWPIECFNEKYIINEETKEIIEREPCELEKHDEEKRDEEVKNP